VEKAHWPIRTVCRTLGVSPSGYYAWRARPQSRRAEEDQVLRRQLRVAAVTGRGTYGRPRLQHALRHAGYRVGPHRLRRLMRLEAVQGRAARRWRATTCADAHAAPAPNLLRQHFAVAAPNRVWGADITAIPASNGWLYLAVVLDLCSRRIVGWALRRTMHQDLVCAALHLALGRRTLRGPVIHHSDRGAQYTSDRYQQLLAHAGLVCSMSRAGNCYDNAPVESFFRTLKRELFDRPAVTAGEATATIADYIERFYNRERLHSSLHYVSPVAFEATFAGAV
jgi:putative transposase